MSKCNCFLCKNSENKERVYGYLYAEHYLYKSLYKRLKELGVQEEAVGNDTLGGLLSVIHCNMDDSGVLLYEVENELGIKNEEGV